MLFFANIVSNHKLWQVIGMNAENDEKLFNEQ